MEQRGQLAANAMEQLATGTGYSHSRCCNDGGLESGMGGNGTATGMAERSHRVAHWHDIEHILSGTVEELWRHGNERDDVQFGDDGSGERRTVEWTAVDRGLVLGGSE